MRRVLIVEQGGRGGVADYSGCLAQALADRGLEVTLATARDHRYRSCGYRVSPIFAYLRDTSRLGRLVRRAGLGRLANGLRFLIAIPRLVALAWRSDVVHVQGWERSSLGLAATAGMLLARRPIVYTAHNTFERRRLALDSTRLFTALARETIVHTASDRARLNRPVHVIPHGHYLPLAAAAAPPAPDSARAALGLEPEDLVVLLFGHLRPDKGLGDLLQALQQSKAWKGLIAGEEDGALSASAALLSAPELRQRIVVREGFHESAAVATFFAAADLVALPYHQVSQSGVLHLAYAFATPVVAYPVGGLVESVLHDRTGWLTAQATPLALAQALDRAAQAGRAELRRLGEQALDWAADEFDWAGIAAATEQVYRIAAR